MRKTNIALILGLALAFGCKSTPKPAAPEGAPGAGAGQPEPEAAQAAAGQLGGDAQKVTLREQRTSILVEQHLTQSRQLLAEVRLDEAEREVESALELEPDSLAGQKLRAEILAMKGQRVGSTQSNSEQLTELYKLRVQQMRADAQDGLQKSKLMIARSDYAGAVAELEIVNNLVHYAPYSIDWQGMDTEAKTLLESTRATRESAERSAEEQKSRQAFAALQAEEGAKNARRTAQIANTLEQAVAAFDRADYDEAESLAKQVLEKDPRNDKAEELRDAAFRAGRTAVQRGLRAAQEGAVPALGGVAQGDADPLDADDHQPGRRLLERDHPEARQAPRLRPLAEGQRQREGAARAAAHDTRRAAQDQGRGEPHQGDRLRQDDHRPAAGGRSRRRSSLDQRRRGLQPLARAQGHGRPGAEPDRRHGRRRGHLDDQARRRAGHDQGEGARQADHRQPRRAGPDLRPDRLHGPAHQHRSA